MSTDFLAPLAPVVIPGGQYSYFYYGYLCTISIIVRVQIKIVVVVVADGKQTSLVLKSNMARAGFHHLRQH